MNKNILIVDDDKRLRVLLKDYLTEKNLQVYQSEDYNEAKEILSLVLFDLIILDRMMPSGDGIELIEHIKQFSNTPIIMLTAMGEDKDKIDGLKIGADDYLSKPFEPEELFLRIKNLLGKTANLTFRFITKTNDETFGSEQLEFEDGSEIANVSKRIIVSGENLIDAQPRMDNQTNETVVTFDFDRVGAKRFGKATSTGIGKRLAIVLDGKVISAPVIRDTIATGSGQISGGFTFQSATDLALLLRSGALPAPLNIIEERTVGPDLGQDSINAGMIALLIGFILVILYIFVKYKIFGIITNIALILNLFILVGILTIFEATLTLPGIAGIILTVGMAVDANVLIFERIKEELKSEKNNLIAFDSGYTKSRTAILDANITTLLAAIILFFMGSGPIKGFSLTLGIGIFTTLFTVYFIARLLTVLYVSKNKEKEGLI